MSATGTAFTAAFADTAGWLTAEASLLGAGVAGVLDGMLFAVSCCGGVAALGVNNMEKASVCLSGGAEEEVAAGVAAVLTVGAGDAGTGKGANGVKVCVGCELLLAKFGLVSADVFESFAVAGLVGTGAGITGSPGTEATAAALIASVLVSASAFLAFLSLELSTPVPVAAVLFVTAIWVESGGASFVISASSVVFAASSAVSVTGVAGTAGTLGLAAVVCTSVCWIVPCWISLCCTSLSCTSRIKLVAALGCCFATLAGDAGVAVLLEVSALLAIGRSCSAELNSSSN